MTPSLAAVNPVGIVSSHCTEAMQKAAVVIAVASAAAILASIVHYGDPLSRFVARARESPFSLTKKLYPMQAQARTCRDVFEDNQNLTKCCRSWNPEQDCVYR
jgi:hypothetical protein